MTIGPCWSSILGLSILDKRKKNKIMDSHLMMEILFQRCAALELFYFASFFPLLVLVLDVTPLAGFYTCDLQRTDDFLQTDLLLRLRSPITFSLCIS